MVNIKLKKNIYIYIYIYIYYRLYNGKIHYKILINNVKKGIGFEFHSIKFATKDAISV